MRSYVDTVAATFRKRRTIRPTRRVTSRKPIKVDVRATEEMSEAWVDRYVRTVLTMEAIEVSLEPAPIDPTRHAARRGDPAGDA